MGLLKQASFIQHAQGALQAPETRRILAGAALGGVAGGLGGAALDRENRGRGALLGGAGGVLLGAGAGHLANRAVQQATAPLNAQVADHAAQLAGLRRDLTAGATTYTDSMHRMLSQDFKVPFLENMGDEERASHLNKLISAAEQSGRRNAQQVLKNRAGLLNSALQAGDLSGAQEHHGRLSSLIERLSE